MKWRFLDKLGQFWNQTVGKLVPRLQVRRWADRSIDAAPVAEWASDLASGRLTLDRWEALMRERIKLEMLKQYAAGIGGVDRMTARDYGSVGGMIADQYRYLSRFAREIADGNLTEGQILRRMRMYVNSCREAYERAYRRAAAEAELDEERWVMDPQAEHCSGDPGCIELSALGWQPVSANAFGGRLPGSGHTPCLTNCRCHIERRRARGRRRE